MNKLIKILLLLFISSSSYADEPTYFHSKKVTGDNIQIYSLNKSTVTSLLLTECTDISADSCTITSSAQFTIQPVVQLSNSTATTIEYLNVDWLGLTFSNEILTTQCNTGYAYNDITNECESTSNCDELSGTNAVPIGWINFGTNPSNTLSNHTSCINGCTVFYEGHNEPQAEVIIESVSNYYGLGLYTYQLESEECNVGLNTTILNIEAEPTPSCAPGDDPTLINGLFACENNGIEVETEQPETETTTTDIVDNGDGTTTETQVTTNSNTGVITTTVIDTTTATGESTTTTTVTNDNSNFNYQSENQSDFCANNPNATICQTNQVSNTSCGTTPTCSGDAIQCAILIQAHEKNCEGENFVDAAVTTAQENAILSGVGGDNDLDTFAAGTEVDLSDPLSGYVPNITAACPPDILINTTRGQITVPMSYFCDLTDLLRPIVLILAYITAAMIFYNGLIREA